MEQDILRQAMSIMGKRSAEKRRLDPTYNEKMREIAKRPRGTKGKPKKKRTGQENVVSTEVSQ